MSKTIDEKVVSMQFDNKNFESNVKETMSTLDKLKEKLNFKGASKGLDNVSNAAKKVDLSSLNSGVDTLKLKFSALDVVGVTAISRITNSMMSFAHKTVSFLTSGVIKGGLNRAMNLENAHFQLLGLLKDEQKVAAVMDDVSKSVDGTAYSLDQAAVVASQMAASGMEAGDKMYSALRAVAGVAATTNSEYAGIGRIFAQVAGQGRLMGNDLLQLSTRGMNAAATLADYLTKVGNGAKVTESEVRTMVSKGQIDFETFAAAMDDAFGDHATKANETFNGALANIKSALSRIGAAFYQPLITANGPLVNLFNAIRVRINEVKDKVVPTIENVSNRIGKAINTVTSLVNGNGFGKSNARWDELAKKIESVGVPLEEFQNGFKEVAKQYGIDMDKLVKKSGSFGNALTKIKNPGKLVIETLNNIAKECKKTAVSQEELQGKLEKFQAVVDKVWHGDYKNQPFRADLLEKAGYKYAEVQTLVNRTVDQHRLTLEDLSEAQLISLGYTDEEIKAIKELAAQAEASGTPLSDLIDNLGKMSKSQLIFETLANVVQPVTKIIGSFKEALNGAFTLSKNNSVQGILEALHSLSESFVMSDESAKNLTRTFKGLFAAIDLIVSIVGGVFNFTFRVTAKVLEKLFQALGLTNDTLLSFTGNIGDAIVKLRDWYKEHDFINKVIDATATIIAGAIEAIARLIKKFTELEAVQKIVDGFKESVENFSKDISTFADSAYDSLTQLIDAANSLSLDDLVKKFGKTPGDMIKGFIKGLGKGTKTVITSIVKLASDIIDGFKDKMGIHSPSTVFIELGKYCIKGLTVGFGSGLAPIVTLINKILDLLTSPFNKINFDDISKRMDALGKAFNKGKDAVVGFIQDVPWDKLATIAISGGLLYILRDLVKVMDALVKPLQGVDNVLNAVAGTIAKFGKIEEAYAKKIKAESFKTIAEAIAILVGSLIALTFVDTDKLLVSISVIIALSGALAGLSFALSKMELKDQDFAKLAAFMASLGVSILLISKAVMNVGKLKPEQAMVGVGSLIAIVGAIGVLMIVMNSIPSELKSEVIDSMSKMILKLSVALSLFAVAIKIMGTLNQNDITNGILVIGGFLGVMKLLALIMKDGTKFKNLGKTMLQISASLILLTIAIKMLGILNETDIKRGIVVITLFLAFIGILVNITKVGKKDKIAQVSGIIMAISAAMILMAVAAKIMGSMSEENWRKGIGSVGLFGLLCVALASAVEGIEGKTGRIALTLIGMATAIAIMAGTCIILGLIDEDSLYKGIEAIAVFSLLITAMVLATENAKDVKGAIMMMAVSIATMAISVAALSMIDSEKLAGATVALGALMFMFSVMTRALRGVSMNKQSMIAIGVLELVVATMGIVLWQLCKLPMNKALSVATAISELMAVFTICLGALTVIGNTGPASFVGIGALLTLLTGIITVASLIGGIVKKFPVLEEFLDKGISILNKIAKGIGEFFGNIVSGFISTALDFIPDVGTKLTDFWNNGKEFFDGIKSLGSDTITSVESLAKAILILTAANIVEGIGKFIAGSTNYETFSNGIETLGKGVASFAKECAGIDSAVVKAGAESVKALAEASTNMPKDSGWLQKIVGSIDVEDFGNKLPALGIGVATFATKVNGINSESVKMGAEAIKSLAEASKSMPKKGGWLQKIVGEVDASDFASKLEALGDGLGKFSEKAGSFNPEVVKSGAEAIKTLANVKLPKHGGLWQKITGESGFTNFGTNLTQLGEGLKDFADSFSEANGDNITGGIKAIKSIVNMCNDINDISVDSKNFLEACTTVGTSISTLQKMAGDVTTDQMVQIQNNVLQGKTIIQQLSGIDTSGVDPYVTAINKLVNTPVNDLDEKYNGGAKKAISGVGNIISSIINAINGGAPLISQSFGKAGENSLATVASYTPKFKTEGSKYSKGLGSGIKSGTGLVKSVASAVANAGVNSSRNSYSGFHSAGSYLTSGFTSGILSKVSNVVKVAASMAKSAADTVAHVLGIRSPSRVLMRMGRYFVEGFAKGITQLASTAVNASSNMAEQATDGVKTAIETTRGLITGEIEFDPTIKPIVDLSSVRNGINQVDSMIGRQRSLELAGAININSTRQSMQDTFNEAMNTALDKMQKNIQNDDTNVVYSFQTNVDLDGKTIARGTAKYTQDELNRLQRRDNRKRGIL